MNLIYILIVIYTLALIVIFFYSIAQLSLLINYIKARKNKVSIQKFNFSNPNEIPYVTIQLPVYNELYVMERLLNNISKIKYPREKLEIQVLDDSTDSSIEITSKKIKELSELGINIKHIRRSTRKNFKAGALKAGLKVVKGEFIAIFDADFLPNEDWLLRTVPYFKDSKIGALQTRWGHINKNYSILTKVQAFALDSHFIIEQLGRNSKGYFINFNGSGGIWRKECIYDSGNWKGDTLTEDLDLSYRAQLKNWKIKFLADVETPAELPIAISAARSQQFRWNKGGTQNFRKLIKQIILNSKISIKTKIHCLFHLLNSSIFLFIFLIAIISLPMLYIKNEYKHLENYFYIISFLLLSVLIFFIYYWYMYKAVNGGGFLKFIKYIGAFVTFISVTMGFSFHNTIAVLEGLFGKKSDFMRTPKFNVKNSKDTWKTNKYIDKRVSRYVVFEGLLAIYFLFGMYSAFIVGNKGGDFGLFPFHFMFFTGFSYVFFKSIFSKY